jgi:hypothetical protein
MVYIESKVQEAREEHIAPEEPSPVTTHNYTSAGLYQQTMTYPTPAWAPISPLLYALGLAEDLSLSVDETSGLNANLENWFNGNQHITGLLEDDLSYLDPAALNFSGT